MKRQATLQNLKELGSDIMSWVRKVMDCPEQDMFKLLGALPNHPFLNFIKFTMIDFLLNCMRTTRYNDNDERTAYCEIFIPIFKAFGNTTQKLEYAWCEKKAKDSDYIWLATNNFIKQKGNLKLLDGIGSLTVKELNYLIIESSGYNNANGSSHALNDTLKNIKAASDNLKSFISNYKQASFNTLKRVRLYTCQIIENKMTLVRYMIKSPSQWQVVECCSASVPLTFSEAIKYTKVFHLFAFLYVCILEHETTLPLSLIAPSFFLE